MADQTQSPGLGEYLAKTAAGIGERYVSDRLSAAQEKRLGRNAAPAPVYSQPAPAPMNWKLIGGIAAAVVVVILIANRRR